MDGYDRSGVEVWFRGTRDSVDKNRWLSWEREREKGIQRTGKEEEEEVDNRRVPEVGKDRTDKLALLEIIEGTDEDAEEFIRETSTNGRGTEKDRHQLASNFPPVERIPDVASGSKPSPRPPGPVHRLSATSIDLIYCPERGGERCAFLVPAWLGEQETKAQLHLYQLGLLALSLNRTLVLPNVSKSRMGTCYSHEFTFYYDSSSLSSLLGLSTISQTDFLSWVNRRHPSPTSQVLSIVGTNENYPGGAAISDALADPKSVPDKPGRNLCLSSAKTTTKLNFSRYSPLAIYPPPGYHKTSSSQEAFAKDLIETLSNPSIASRSYRHLTSPSSPYLPADVLSINYELRYPIFTPELVYSVNPSLPRVPSPFSHFPYSAQWTDLASSIATSLSPFVAVHWRTETLSSKVLEPCAEGLLERLNKMKVQYPDLKRVYLATDYPIEELLDAESGDTGGKGDRKEAISIPHSGTFYKFQTKQHTSAMKLLLSGFSSAHSPPIGLELVTFASLQSQSQSQSESPNGIQLADLDPGLIGIIDKEVAMRAEVFVKGSTVDETEGEEGRACAKVSSFTRQIVEERQRGGGEGRWNVVERWGVSG